MNLPLRLFRHGLWVKMNKTLSDRSLSLAIKLTKGDIVSCLIILRYRYGGKTSSMSSVLTLS